MLLPPARNEKSAESADAVGSRVRTSRIDIDFIAGILATLERVLAPVVDPS
jgi:hypothetical protein